MSQVQFYKAVIIIPGVPNPIPVLPGARLTVPRNWVVPPVIGNYWQWNYGEGVKIPVMDCSVLVRDNAGEALSSSLFGYFFNRTNDSAHDTTPMGNVTFWDGATGYTLNNAKAESFTLGTSMGDNLRMSMRLMGSSITQLTGSFSYPTSFNNANVLRFQSVNFASTLASKVWRFDLSFSNNHNPNYALNGTVFPTEVNAGVMSAGFNIIVQANDVVPPVPPPGTNCTPISFTITGSSHTCTFTISNPLDNTDYNRSVDPPRVMRQHTYVCLGGDGQVTEPIQVSSTF